MPFEASKTKFTVFSLNQELFNLIYALKYMSGFMETVLIWLVTDNLDTILS